MKLVLSLLFLVWSWQTAFSQSVIFYPDPDQDLATRWSSSLPQGMQTGSDFWIGYSFPRLMKESEYVGSNIRFEDGTATGRIRGNFEPDSFIGKPLNELLKQERSSFRKDSEKKVKKQIAILHLLRVKSGKPTIQLVEFGNVDLPFELRNLPLVWLGETNAEQSFDHLTKNFEASSKDLHKNIIYAIGLHPLPDRVVPFANNVIANKSLDNELRKAAVYSLSDQEDEKARTLLLSIANSDSIPELSKAAVYALGKLVKPDGAEVLYNLQRTAKSFEAKKAAIYALGKIEEPETIDLLIKILKSETDPRLRKAAIYALGKIDSPEAKSALLEIQKQ